MHLSCAFSWPIRVAKSWNYMSELIGTKAVEIIVEERERVHSTAMSKETKFRREEVID